MATIRIKRVYEPIAKTDGFRILVDRLWPRGIKKEDAHVAIWLKEIAPSTELRKWFNHDPEKWEAFRKRYLAELQLSPAAEELLEQVKKHAIVTLVYSAKDEQHNQAVVIKEFLENELPGK